MMIAVVGDCCYGGDGAAVSPCADTVCAVAVGAVVGLCLKISFGCRLRHQRLPVISHDRRAPVRLLVCLSV